MNVWQRRASAPGSGAILSWESLDPTAAHPDGAPGGLHTTETAQEPVESLNHRPGPDPECVIRVKGHPDGDQDPGLSSTTCLWLYLLSVSY